jgi:ABC-2 type transport system ATP-binding protein
MEGRASEAGPVAAGQRAVEAVGLRKTFGPIVAVDGVDLALERGRVYGMLGPNGSGKTTLIRLLLGLARPTAGHATVLGTPMPSAAVLRRVGYMPQGEGIYPDLSAMENLRFFAGLNGVSDSVRLRQALELVELADRADTPVLELSGGLRRRLSLACALAHDPQLLVLDEPTVGVDPSLRVQFWDHFRRLAAAGATLLVSSHVMDEADRCDELLLLRAGRVIARGSGAEIRARAGTPNLEAAFLALDGQASPGGRIP